jgi:hypothetical protein
MMGTGKRLREFNRDIKLVAIQPEGPFHGLEGLKHMETASHVPELFDAKGARPDRRRLHRSRAANGQAIDAGRRALRRRQRGRGHLRRAQDRGDHRGRVSSLPFAPTPVRVTKAKNSGRRHETLSYIALHQIHRHLESGYPNEACGVMLGKDGVITEIVSADNQRTDSASVGEAIVT